MIQIEVSSNKCNMKNELIRLEKIWYKETEKQIEGTEFKQILIYIQQHFQYVCM